MDEASLTLYQNGSLALKQARYDDAIACLERFCQETVNRQSQQFFQAQMWLIQAYHKDHKDLHAIALCEQLVKSDIPQVKQWADKALHQLMKTPETAPETARSTLQPSPAPTVPPADTTHSAPHAARSAPLDQAGLTTTPRQSTTPRLATYPTSRRRPPSTQKSGPKDYTGQIMTGLAHGSISMLASILLFILFSDSFIANALGLVRFIVPVFILLTTQDDIVKANAREATNYVLTSLILMIPLGLAFFLLIFIFVAAWPLAVLLGLALGSYLLVFSVYPAIATVLCLTQEDHVFRYPDWLILHLI